MVWLNTSSIIGMMLINATVYVTGDLIMTYFLLSLVCVLLCLIFGMPFEFGLIVTTPLNIYLMAADSGFLPIGGLVLFVLAISLAIRFKG